MQGLKDGIKPFQFKHSREFLRAVKSGNYTEVVSMVNERPEIVLSFDHVHGDNTQVGQNGVHYAILRNQIKILDFLLKNFAPKDDVCHNGKRAIDIALKEKNVDAVMV